MVKTVLSTAGAVEPHRSGRFEHGVGATNVDLDEGIRAADRPIDMRFGGEVNDRIDRSVAQERLDQLLIPDVTVLELEAGVLPRRGQACKVSSVGQRVQDNEDILGVLAQPVVDEVRANEAGATSDK